MARKRRAPSPPPQETSTDSGSDTDREEESRRAGAHQKPPQNPQSHTPAAAAEGADSSEGESDAEEDADAFQMHPVSHPGSDAESSESEPEDPEPVQKKAAATTNKSRTAVTEDKKRPALEPAPTGRAKKTKVEAVKAAPEVTPAGKGKKRNAAGREKAAPEATPAGKGKKRNAAKQEKAAPEATPAGKGKKTNDAELEKAVPEATPAGKGMKAKKPADKPENPGLDTSPPSKSARTRHRWSKADLIRILEAMVAHVQTKGDLPKNDVLFAAVRDRLDRKDCAHHDIYEKVRRLREGYEKAVKNGIMPSEEDDLQIYNLSETIWGKKTKEAMAAAASQNNSTATMNKNGQTKKGIKKGHSVEGKTDKDVKSKPSKEGTAAASSKSSKLGNVRQESGKDPKSGTLKETTTIVTQNGDAMTKRKGEKMGKDKMDIDLKALTGSQNHGAQTEEEAHQEETEIGASAEGTQRSFDELQDLYPCLAGYVKKIETESTCGETLKRSFEFIGNEKAIALERKIKTQRLSELKAQMRREGLKKDALNMLISSVD